MSVFFLTTQVNAQLCGKYSTTVNILSENDKKVENIFVQLLPLDKDETKGKTFKQSEEDVTKFIITFQEGHQLTNQYKVIIPAQQFETYEMELKFPHCKNQDFDVKLNPISQKSAILSGIVYDINKARVVGTEITIKGEKTTIKTKTDESGYYLITLPVGKYTIEFTAIGFKRLTVKELIVDDEINKKFNVTLEVGRCEDCNGAIYGERWDDFTVFNGHVYDTSSAVIENAEITFRDSEGKITTIKTNDKGFYTVKIPIGIYSIEVKAIGFKVFKIERYKAVGIYNAITNYKGLNLDVVLEVKNCDDPSINCSSVTADMINK